MRFLLLLLLVLPVTALAQTKNYDFSAPDAASLVQSYAMPGGVVSGAQASLEKGALKLVNRKPGSFGVQWKLTPFDADQVANLEFDFKASPDSKINFFFRVNGQYYGAILTGPPTLRPGSVLLGKFAITDLPGGWKHAEIPLHDWLRATLPTSDEIIVDEVISGNWDNEGYLLAGIGGNGPGATISFDNFALTPLEASPTPPRVLTPFWQGSDLVVPLEVSAGIDTKTLKLTFAGQTFDFTSPFLSYEVFAQKATWGRQLRFEAGTAGFGARDGEVIPLALDRVQDSLGHSAPRFETSLAFHYSAAQVAPDLPLMQVWNEATDAYEPVPGDDFQSKSTYPRQENSILETDQNQTHDGTASLRLTNPRTASNFKTTLINAPVDIARFPVLTFDYLTDNRVRLDWRFNWNTDDLSVQFLDHDTKATRAGKIDDVQSDSQWHSADANLLSMLQQLRSNTKILPVDTLSDEVNKDQKKAAEERKKIEVQRRTNEIAQNILNAPNFQISNLGLADDGWLGNARGVQIWLDNLRFAPAVKQTLKAKFILHDLSGTQALAWTFDQNRDTSLPVPKENLVGVQYTKSDNLQISLDGRSQGLWWLHLRAQNGNGLWSDMAHFPVWVVAS